MSWCSKTPTAQVEEEAAIVREEMTSAIKLKVPLKVEGRLGEETGRK